MIFLLFKTTTTKDQKIIVFSAFKIIEIQHLSLREMKAGIFSEASLSQHRQQRAEGLDSLTLQSFVNHLICDSVSLLTKLG